MDIIIVDSNSASVSLHTIPDNIEDVEEYATENLDLDSNCEWMSADKIIIQDFRKKK